MGEKLGVRKKEQAGRIICHAVFLAQVTKDGNIQDYFYGMESANGEKVSSHQVDHLGFESAPGDGWNVVET